MSYPCRLFKKVNEVTELRSLPLCSSSCLSLLVCARHVDGRLFGLNMLYLSSLPWQPAVPMLGQLTQGRLYRA